MEKESFPSQKEPAQDGKQDIDWEKRFKDTEKSFHETRQEVSKLKARNEVLENLASPKVDLTPEQETELEELKFSDPDAWRSKINSYETEAEKKISEDVSAKAELNQRNDKLNTFLSSHQDISAEMIEYDVPRRIHLKLENGDVSFDDFLQEAADYLKHPKTIGDGNKPPENDPDLSKLGGGSSASDSAQSAAMEKSYKDEIY